MISLDMLPLVLGARTSREAWCRRGRFISWVLTVQLVVLSGHSLSASAAHVNDGKQASSKAKIDLSPWQQVTRWEGAFRAVRTYSFDFQSPMAHDTNDFRWVVSGRVVLDEVKPGDSDHGLTHLGWRGKVSATVSYSARGFVTNSHRMEDGGSGNNTSEAQLDMAANGNPLARNVPPVAT